MLFKKKAVRNSTIENLNKYLVGLQGTIDDCKYYTSVFATNIDNAIEKARDFFIQYTSRHDHSIQSWTLIEVLLLEPVYINKTV